MPVDQLASGGSRIDHAYGPHGAVLLDYFHGNASATLICVQDGERDGGRRCHTAEIRIVFCERTEIER